MNTEEFRRTGGIDASKPTFRKALKDSSIPPEVQEAIIEAGKQAMPKNPGGESSSQMLLDSFNHYQEGVLAMHIGNLLKKDHYHHLRMWTGRKAARQKKLLKEWSRNWLAYTFAHEIRKELDKQIIDELVELAKGLK
jgi:hypothetical protein